MAADAAAVPTPFRPNPPLPMPCSTHSLPPHHHENARCWLLVEECWQVILAVLRASAPSSLDAMDTL